MNARPDKPVWSDVQGLVVSGYGHLRHSSVLVFRIRDGQAAHARIALGRQLALVTTAAKEDGRRSPQHQAVNVAFTYSGLTKLGPPNAVLSGFDRAFVGGMAGTLHRSRALGDVGGNAPSLWRWGNAETHPPDGVIFLYASSRQALVDLRSRLTDFEQYVEAVADVATAVVSDGSARQREPFGFADGLSQPLLEGTRQARRHPDSPHVVRLGEFVLGYEDNAGIEVTLPAVDADDALGINGTYVAVRQLEQHVDRFHQFLAQQAQTHGIPPEVLAAKMMGRTFDGDVLTADGSAHPAGQNDFGYAADADGLGCPLGAHIRRGTPRDMLGKTAAEGWRITNRHRILRRGRPYREHQSDGRAVDEHGTVTAGLLFVALNADLERQFEFIHGNWMNDAGFAELADERDPIIGWRSGTEDSMRIPQRPARRRLTGLPAFVTTRGGAYFFMPGLRGLALLLGA